MLESNGTHISIRVAVRGDLPAILPLMALLNPDDPTPDAMDAKQVWESILADRRTSYLVAEIAGEVAGACCLVVVPNLTRGLRSFAVIENVIVHPRWRRNGIATRLLEAAVASARAEGCYKAMLMSNRKRVEAHPLYRACGFESDSKLGFDMRL